MGPLQIQYLCGFTGDIGACFLVCLFSIYDLSKQTILDTATEKGYAVQNDQKEDWDG